VKQGSKSGPEAAIYNNLPKGSSIPVQFIAGITTDIDRVFVPYSLLINWDQVQVVSCGNAEADCNEDGLLNLADFGCFNTRYGLGCP
jgi:hypothetical protein